MLRPVPQPLDDFIALHGLGHRGDGRDTLEVQAARYLHPERAEEKRHGSRLLVDLVLIKIRRLVKIAN